MHVALVVSHVVGIACLAVGSVVQIFTGHTRLFVALVAGSVLALLSGLLLAGSQIAGDGGAPNYPKLLVKLIVTLTILLVVLRGSRRGSLRRGWFGTVLGLTLLNAAIAGLWS